MEHCSRERCATTFYFWVPFVDNDQGYVKSGDPINIEREEQDGAPPPPKGKGNDKGKKKQLSIATMMKAQPKNFKKKTNSVVRLTNARGFGRTYASSTDRNND